MADKKESPEAAASREEKAMQQIRESLDRVTAATGVQFTEESVEESSKAILSETAVESLHKAKEFHIDIEKVSKAFLDWFSKEIGDLFEEHASSMQQLYAWLKSSADYSIVLEAALEDLKQQVPDIENYSLFELFDEDFEDNGIPVGKLYKEAEDRARKRIEADQAAQNLNITALTARKHVALTGTVWNYLAGAGGKKLINAGQQELRVGEDRKNAPITAIANILFEGVPLTKDGSLELYSLSSRQQTIFTGITSIIYEANSKNAIPTFTLDSLYRAIPGGGDRAGRKTKDELLHELETFQSIKIEKLDITEEVKARHLVIPNGFIGENDTVSIKKKRLLDWHILEIKKAGKVYNLYVIDSCPFFDYALATKQMVITDRKNVTICKLSKVNGKECFGNPVNMTLEKQAIVAYLIRRIEIMRRDYRDAVKQKREYDKKRERNNSDPNKTPLPEKAFETFRNQYDTILMQTLFKETETESTDKNENKRTRDFVFLVLDNFRLRGLIAGYKKRTQGRVTTAIEIQHTIDTAEETEKEA